jgi:hypothetical protein
MTPATKFLSGSGEWVSLSDMVTRINLFLGDIEEYSLEVGTDSQTNGQTKFVTAIVVHKSGKGGIFFYHPHITKKIHVLSERIYTETALSINCATLLLEMFLEMDILREITIHCDVGSKGKTRELIREIVGYVTASGFDCKIKPEATTACTVADKFSK